jgi:hypothetical protein
MKTRHEFINNMQLFVGLLLLAFIAVAAVAAVIYGLLGYAGPQAHRIIATVLVMILPAAYWLGRREGKAHSDGFDHGVKAKVAAQTRSTAAPSAMPQTARPGLAPTWQDILPAPVDIQIKQADSDVVIL